MLLCDQERSYSGARAGVSPPQVPPPPVAPPAHFLARKLRSQVNAEFAPADMNQASNGKMHFSDFALFAPFVVNRIQCATFPPSPTHVESPRLVTIIR